MINVCSCFQVSINLEEIVEVIAYTDYMGNVFLPGFLSDNKLFDRVFINKPYVGMGIKKLHVTSSMWITLMYNLLGNCLMGCSA